MGDYRYSDDHRGFKIDYTDSKTGESKTHRYSGSYYNAKMWEKGLQRDHGGRTVLREERRDHPDREIQSSTSEPKPRS